jgi:hypothetical protein
LFSVRHFINIATLFWLVNYFDEKFFRRLVFSPLCLKKLGFWQDNYAESRKSRRKVGTAIDWEMKNHTVTFKISYETA